MPELRWILLILGLVFLVALAWWELRRQRRFPAPREEPTQHRFREPTLGLPEMRPREPAPPLPVVEIEDDSMIGLRVDGVRIEEDIQTPQPAEVALPEPAPAEAAPLRHPGESNVTPAKAGAQSDELPSLDPGLRRDDGAATEPIVDWPPEEERKLLAVRILAKSDERFSGRAVRLALSAEGFVFGKHSIFHKPGADARAIVSAASLIQPGTFDLPTMDTQRFGGIYLFAVLPGPMPDAQMSVELISAAHALNERLQGVLRDERGEPSP
jgi:cell division protein ZipA